MRERIVQELALVEEAHGELELGPNLEWVIVNRWPLPLGWNKVDTSVLVLIPPGYPTTPPDNFYTDSDLRLTSGAEPGCSSAGPSQAGRNWKQFSYHLEGGDWQPHAEIAKGHTLLSYFHGVGRRLSEAD